jgi:tetrahydromethanopterin S-methyltransferase subunit G
MTDMYGTEPHDHDAGHDAGHDDVLTHNLDAVHEPPSDFEFSDEHGGPAVSEEHENVDEHALLNGDEGVSSRRSPLLPIAAAVGGVLLLGGVAWWQFGSPSSPPPAPIANAVPMARPMDNAGQTNTTVAPKTASAASLAANPSGTEEAPQPISAAPVAVPVAQSAPQAAPSQPSYQPIPRQAAIPQQAPEPPQQAAAAEDSARLNALDGRMDDLQKSIEQTSQQISQVASMVAATATSASNAAAENKATEDRLDKIEQEVGQLRHPAPVLAAPSVQPGDQPVAPMAADTAPVRKHKAVHVASLRHVSHHHHATTVVSAEMPSWVLRAASPGQAWVASSSTSHDLTQLHVGDSLGSVGRVTAIQQQDDGSWMVQGTKGVIR